MSQFRETFTRGSKKDSVLSYDDFASRIFTSGFMVCFLLPITIYFFKKWLFGKPSKLPVKLRLSDQHIEDKKKPSVKCECSLCKKRRTEEEKRVVKFKDYFTLSRVVQVLILVFFWWLVVYLIAGINPDDNIKKFDPFELLGLSTDATKKDIQKAYRHLSLKFHPDRNPNDPEMSAHFVLITKAYRTLTNEVSRMNYAKYGNPDGPGMMKIGIGLPRFLVDENNQIVILTLFFLTLLIVVPSLFIWYYRTQKCLTATGIRVETLQLIYYTLNENTRNKSLPELYACCTEMASVPFHSSEETDLRKYFDVLRDYKRKNINAETFRTFVLLLCHMDRVDDLNPRLMNSQKEILKYSMMITQCMLDVAVAKGWLLTFRSVIDFRRGILHGIQGRSEAFYQLPHFTETEIKHVMSGKHSCKHIEDYVRVSPQSKKGLNSLSKNEQNDVHAFCRYFPDLTLEVEVYVEGEKEIYEGDLVTVEVRLIRNNLKENELIGPVHAPYFPFVKYEQYYFLVTYPPQALYKEPGNLNHLVEAKLNKEKANDHGGMNSHGKKGGKEKEENEDQNGKLGEESDKENNGKEDENENFMKEDEKKKEGKDSSTKEEDKDKNVKEKSTKESEKEVRMKDWENNIFLNFNTNPSREREIVEKLQILAEKTGNNTICVTALNDSYFGADVSVLKKFYVIPLSDKKNQEFKIHPEDLKLDEEVNPIAKMLGELLTVESSEEEEVDYVD